MNHPNITNKQKEIIFALYQFRFLNTQQVQKILGHKNPKRIQIWLKDLKDKGYMRTDYSPRSFMENTKPAIYYLASKSIYILKQMGIDDHSNFKWIYKEKIRKKKFINICLAIADVYIFFASRKTEKEDLNFFTASQLARFDYFPDPLPSAYISIKTEKGVKRFFLDLFDEYIPPFVLRSRIKTYMSYFETGNWQENTNNSPFPSILFICPNNRLKNHIRFYSKALLDKTFNDDIALFLTTRDILSIPSVKNEIWEKVE